MVSRAMRSRRSGLEIAQGPHVVHAVGQLDHDDADILHHGQQHFAEALRLPVLGGEEIQLGQLGDAVHAARHFLAELLAHLLDGDAGILHHVVQQAGLHGDQVHAHLRQDVGHHDGVRPCKARRSRASALHAIAARSGKPFPTALRSSLGRYSRISASSSRYDCSTGSGGHGSGQRFRNAGGLGGHSTSIVAMWRQTIALRGLSGLGKHSG